MLGTLRQSKWEKHGRVLMGFLPMVGRECLQKSGLKSHLILPKTATLEKGPFLLLLNRALCHLYTRYSSETPPQEGKVTFAVPTRSQDTAESAGAGAGGAALQFHRCPELLNLTSTDASFSPSENCGE